MTHMENNKKYVELLWHDKYDKIELGNKMPINRRYRMLPTISKDFQKMHDIICQWKGKLRVDRKSERGTRFSEYLLKRIILASSNPGNIVVEKLGRRWIGCDLSKFAIQVTRKRVLDIHNSKDIMEE